MNIARFSLEHKPVIAILLILALVVGVVNYFTISQREDPEFKISVALVVTIYPGGSAEKVERLVTNKLEEKFAEITEMDEITSTTREDLSVIMVRVDYTSDTDIAWQKLRNKIEEARPELPDSIMGPDVYDDFGDVTAMIYSLSSESATPAELRSWAKDLASRLKRLQSVGKAELLGEQKEVIYIEGPLESFTMFNFSPLVASKFLDYQNVNMPGGYVRTDDRKYRLEVSGSFALTEQIENAVLDVSRQSGTPLKVKDVFSVRRTYKEPPTDYMLANGAPSIGLDIRMKKGHNLVVMGEEVKKEVEIFRELLPPNITLTLLHDQPRQVGNFVQSFMNNLFEGLLIVIVVMFLAMGVRAAGMIAISLPLSIIVTFAIMPLFNVVFETVSIAAFIIALGMLVDNSIIIADNIDVYMRRGMDRLTASWKGAQDLAIPALSGTLATVLAFMPLLLMPREQGDYIRAMPIIVSVSLLASLVLALTITPITAYFLMKPKVVGEQKAGEGGNAAVRIYRRLMNWALRHRYLSLMLTTLAFVGTLALLPSVGFSFFPQAQRDQFMIDIWLPEGSSLAHTAAVVKQVEKELETEKHVKDYVTYVGKGGPRFYITIKPEFNSTNYAQFVVNTDDPTLTRDIVERLNQRMLTNISGARVLVSNLWMGTPVEAPIAIRVSGPDLTVMKRISTQIQNIMKQVPGTIYVRDNIGDPVPSLNVNVDSTAAAMAGITNTEVALSLLTAYEGFPVTSVRDGEDEVPVYMRLLDSERNMTNTLSRITVPSQATGKKVPLEAFAKIEMDWAPGVIKRNDGVRSVTALADVSHRLAADVMNDIRPKLEQIELPKGYTLTSSGEEKDRNEAFGHLITIFALIIMLILLMLVIQFNSFKRAMVILVSIPLAISGAILGLYFSGNSFAFMPFLGVISLAGIVIKNAVVWVEFVDRYLKEGHALDESIIEAGRQRMRPIFLTAATTIGGLIPLALFGGSLWEGMAWAMVVGLAVATVLTLFVVPVVYYVMFRREEARKALVATT
jgi:multidrug efflux pump subunit AcrB